MSFTELKLADIKKVAESFGVDISDIKSKTEIIARLEEEGITYQMYNKFSGAEKEEVKVPEIEKKKRENKMKSENSILVKMDRGNHSYSTNGHMFTQEHPFVAMSESDAQRLFDTQEGFRIATPREAQEFYS